MVLLFVVTRVVCPSCLADTVSFDFNHASLLYWVAMWSVLGRRDDRVLIPCLSLLPRWCRVGAALGAELVSRCVPCWTCRVIFVVLIVPCYPYCVIRVILFVFHSAVGPALLLPLC